MNIIDPHIHLFDLERGQYHWLKPENPPFWSDKSTITKDFDETDLTLSNQLSLTGFVHIEAGFNNEQPWTEIEWLESHCKANFRSVANIDITLPPEKFSHTIAMLKRHNSIVGCRHLLDENTVDTLKHTNVLQNFEILATNNLSFDLQMPLENTEAVNMFSNIMNALPSLRVIINHSGWPSFETNGSHHKNWLKNLNTLSHHNQCAVKCSGWEMVDRNYSTDNVLHVIKNCINTFGYNRVILGSNFPLCLFSTSYQRFWEHNTIDIAKCLNSTPKQLEQLCSVNTQHWYKF